MLTNGNIEQTRFSRSEDGNPFAALAKAIHSADVRAAEAIRKDRQTVDLTTADQRQREAHRIGVEMGFIVEGDPDEMDAPEGCDDIAAMIHEGSL